jgi:AraC-like DNA-binding protein
MRQALAEELLSARRLNVDEVASRLGYSDRSSFITAFKRWRGVSPGRYRPR